MIDRGDGCAGASAPSPRLMHGGLKDLETGEFRLVRQSAEGRDILIRNASHHVAPLETALPIRSWFGGIVPAAGRFFRLKARLDDRGALIPRLGLILYDALGRRFRTMPVHRSVGRSEARKLLPDLYPAIAAVGLHDGARLDHAERLGLELVEDALAAEVPSQVRANCTVRPGAIVSSPTSRRRPGTGRLPSANGCSGVMNEGSADRGCGRGFGSRTLRSLPDYLVGKIEWSARHGRARTDDDIRRRRTDIALRGLASDAVRAAIEAIRVRAAGETKVESAA